MRKTLSLLLILTALCCAATCQAAPTITCAGSWTSQVINWMNLLSGPGSDLAPEYLSPDPAGTLSIAKTGKSTWRVWVRRTASTPASSMTLSVKRTNDGTGNGSISGGTGWMLVDTTYPATPLFTGRKDRSTIGFQVQLGNVSYAVPVSKYLASLVFKVQ